ncbi:MAG: M61 family peptidase [Betaproteobacteria bacterium]
MTRYQMYLRTGAAIVVLLCAQSALAQPDVVLLTVDATRVREQIVRTTETLPVRPGPLTLYYPKWIPGEHAPSGPIANVTGLKITAAGRTLYWQRDLKNAFAFHVDVPQGADHVEASFDYLEPGAGSYTAGASATDKLVVISWNQNLLYPLDRPAQQQTFEAKLVVPSGWKLGTPLPIASQSGDATTFKPVSLNRLVDSPVVAGEYFRAVDITPPGEPIHHEIDIVADAEEDLAMSPQVKQGMTNLVAEAGKLFGSRHYRDYHFLLTLSDHVAHFGLEHHESNDSRLPERTLLTPHAAVALGGLLAHEYAHSWNGKFRRPADLSTPYYDEPEGTDLLWVYEGFTDFAGPLLATRSGLWTEEEYHDYLAGIAAALGPGRPGRTWRPLVDTATGEPVLGSGGRAWQNWRRGTDYYDEGDLLWLDVATVIHDQSHGSKSIDDFCHLFHGGANNGPELKPYTFDDVVHALGQVVPYGWADFLHEKVTSLAPEAPTGGIENGGWKVVFTGEPQRTQGRRPIPADEYSIGLDLRPDGTVLDVIYNGPAFKAGLAPGMKVMGVDGRTYTHERLEDAIKDSPNRKGPIELLATNDDYYRTCRIDYHGGERYPHLERDNGRPDYLDELAKPRAMP